MSELHVECRTGADLIADLPALARLRIRVFREYPYLYEGDAEYEERYLRTYAEAPDGLVVLVRDGARVVGASSALPLAAEPPNVVEPFRTHGYAPERIFYYGESVLLPEYRGLGLGRRFFDEREAHTRRLGRFDFACFCAVERPTDHPRRPADYRPLDGLWEKQGFVKQPQLRTTFSWRDLDETEETPKPMVFWLKRLD
ncbi:GNAT family N-acetyltransferase [Thiocapsa bogorovii]|uniref:GNAT family N-acetyltransferase n=1 Tax=Thiocapsa bogorovii TaxID=521689 RepID=UPI001E59534B|nr:GNAT family N-acetyltransferase [Thiocapsa bogorovii]UHD18773.1 GNAT family N-acetyltransferase [Thiocapsa bogorovii]